MNATGDARPLRVLITNRVLTGRTGTELYVRDLATGLAARGHSPVVYSPFLGEVAREIRAATIPVTDDLATIAEPPDVIHGHHGLETLAALLAFPAAPAVALCHSWTGWQDAPPRLQRVRRFVAVDHTCRDRLCNELGIPPGQVRVLHNAVDLERFRRRGPLPPRPRRALVFSNGAGGRGSHLPVIQEACAAEGIEVEVLGASRRSHARPEEVLVGFDLVFAKARSALEAMATGTAVILCDVNGAGPLVTRANLHRLRPLNFGARTLADPVTVEGLRREIARYDPVEAAAVCTEIRATAGRELLLDQLCELYEEVVAEQQAEPEPDRFGELRSASAYLQRLAPRLYERDLLRVVFQRLLRTPVLGRALRSAGARAAGTHWLPQLLRLESLD